MPAQAQSTSTATTRAALPSTSHSLRPAPQPIETWSSWDPEVGMLSIEAGWHSTRFSATRAAATYWVTM